MIVKHILTLRWAKATKEARSFPSRHAASASESGYAGEWCGDRLILAAVRSVDESTGQPQVQGPEPIHSNSARYPTPHSASTAQSVVVVVVVAAFFAFPHPLYTLLCDRWHSGKMWSQNGS